MGRGTGFTTQSETNASHVDGPLVSRPAIRLSAGFRRGNWLPRRGGGPFAPSVSPAKAASPPNGLARFHVHAK